MEVEVVQKQGAEAGVFEEGGNLVDGIDGGDGNDGLDGDVAKEGNLGLEAVGDGKVAAAEDDVGLDADAAELLDAVLGGLGLELAGGGNIRKERDVEIADVAPAGFVAHLPDGFEEGEALDVADGSANLNDDDLGVMGESVHAGFDLVGDVGNGLNGAAEVVAAALLGNDGAVDLAGGDVGCLAEALVEEAFVVAEVEIGLAAVVGDEDLAVLVRGHGAGVDVEVGVELLDGNYEATALEDAANGGNADALANGTDDATSHKDVFGHRLSLGARTRESTRTRRWG